MQGSQLAELEALYKEEQILRKRYFNTIEGKLCIYYYMQLIEIQILSSFKLCLYSIIY